MRGGIAGPTSIEQALERLEQAHESLIGGLGLTTELFTGLHTVKDGADDAVCGGSTGAAAGSAHHGGTPWGVKASQGTRPTMEDAYSVQVPSAAHHPPHPQSAPLPEQQQEQLLQRRSVAGEHVSAPLASAQHTPSPPASSLHLQPSAEAASPAAPQSQQADAEPSQLAVPPQAPISAPPIPEDLAVLSVFDGHGGTEVAEHCRDRLHMHFAAALSQQRGGSAGRDEAAEGAEDASGAAASPLDRLNSALQSASSHSPSHVSEALRVAFNKIDTELAGTEAGEYVGATAVVAVVGRHHLWIAHCGDSRAVIQRNSEAEALTRDHKPDREDEAARIKAAGGRVVFTSGSYRVMGMLAMSRAIGDHFLRPYVIAEPEVACVERTVHDEVLVLATDGLWDVFSCKEATTLAQRCITRSKERGMSRHGACRVAASVLTKVAIERGSRDNITVIVVDVSMAAQPSTSALTSQLISTPHPTSHTTTHNAASGNTSPNATTVASGSSTAAPAPGDSAQAHASAATSPKQPQLVAGGGEPQHLPSVNQQQQGNSRGSSTGDGLAAHAAVTKPPLLRAHASETTEVWRPAPSSPQPVASGVASSSASASSSQQHPHPQLHHAALSEAGTAAAGPAAPLPPLPPTPAVRAAAANTGAGVAAAAAAAAPPTPTGSKAAGEAGSHSNSSHSNSTAVPSSSANLTNATTSTSENTHSTHRTSRSRRSSITNPTPPTLSTPTPSSTQQQQQPTSTSPQWPPPVPQTAQPPQLPQATATAPGKQPQT